MASYNDYMGGADEARLCLDSFMALSHDEDLQRKWIDYVTALHAVGDMSLEATRYAIARIYGYNPDIVTEADLDLARLEGDLHAVD